MHTVNRVVWTGAAMAFALNLSACSSTPEDDVVTAEPEVELGERILRASGNEPFWTAEVYADYVRYMLAAESWDTWNLLPIVGVQMDESQAEYQFSGGRGGLTITQSICHDTMAGMPFPYTAELSVDGAHYQGCAGDTKDLLLGSQWHVVDVDGTQPPRDASVTLNFDTDGRIYGQGGCNRYFGSYNLTGEGISFSQMGLTRMACAEARMDFEVKYVNTLGNVTQISFNEENELLLSTVQGEVIRASYLPRELK